MSKRAVVLVPSAASLLLELMEMREPMLSGAAAELCDAGARALLATRLLGECGHEDVSASLADHKDVPVPLIASAAPKGALSYFSPLAGLTEVPIERLALYHVQFPMVFSMISMRLRLIHPTPPLELVAGIAWELGDARLDNRKQHVSIWFARRLWDPVIWQSLEAAQLARPHTRTRVILTSTGADRIRATTVSGASVVPLADVVMSPIDIAVSPEILAARLEGAPQGDGDRPITISPDGTTLRINGHTISFKSPTQIAAIRRLVDAYNVGKRLKAADLTTLGSPNRLFGSEKWKLLSPYLKSRDRTWGFEI